MVVSDRRQHARRDGVRDRDPNRGLTCFGFEVTTREIEDLHMRPCTYALATNPAQHADRRREPDPAAVAFYSYEQVEALAQALSAGAHRDPNRRAVSEEAVAARACDDGQDAELVRVPAYTGLRRGELVALRWRDVDFVGQKMIVRRALSGETEVRSIKSRRARGVPLPDQAAAALERLRCRGEFVGPDDYVFANRFGRRTPRLYAAASSAPATPQRSSPCGSTNLRQTYSMGRSWSPAESI